MSDVTITINFTTYVFQSNLSISKIKNKKVIKIFIYYLIDIAIIKFITNVWEGASFP